ncbi:MAG TPA: ABC transporter permease [Ktedonobacterales bacterium]|nr:ABC transporter permease [Ktedonobacterales bacterium]
MTPSAIATNAAPFWRITLAQTRAELLMTLRRGESLLVTVFIPVVLLIAFASLKIANVGITFLVPGVLALAIMSTGMVSLGIATAYERYYGVLKRLGASPLSRTGLILAKTLSVLAVEIGQVIVLSLIAAIFYDWRPAGSFLVFVVILLLGSAVFASLGLLMAGALRAEATLAGANGLFLFLTIFGGSIVPASAWGWFAPIVNLLPSAALTSALYGSLTQQRVSLGSLLTLIVWGAIFLGATIYTFKWE